MAKSSRQSMRDKIRKNAKESISKDAKYINKPEGISFITVPTDGKIKLNFLPYTVSSDRHPDGVAVGDLWYKRPYGLHRNVGVDDQAVICPRSIGKSCPICDRRNEVANSGNADKDLIKALSPSRRVLYVVEPVGEKKMDGIYLLDISEYAFQRLLDKELADADNDAYIGFPDVEGGYTLSVRFDKESFAGRDFAKASSIQFKTREEDLSSKLLKSVPDLDACLNILTAKQILQLLNDLEDGDIDDEDEDGEQPDKRKKERVADDDDDDDTPPADTDDDDDDEEPPKKKSKPAKDDDDDDEDVPPKKRKSAKDDDDDDDDDDEPPKKKRKPAKDDDDDDETPPMKRGRKKKAADDDDDDEPPKKSTRPGSGKCPHGYTWGDSGKKKTQHDECEDCAVWKNCVKG